ncbi:class I SAM-dependent DNA methyltransferase [Streptomyces sp. NPDC001933]|uniref:class I SAM-dependent DNA methyltransferase n=1 Tax=Streptomyces sp. NPDC001933 TaxID=3364626 RepID=UPI0036AF1086
MADVYQSWAPHYDSPGNQIIAIEQPVVRRILDGLPVGTGLDAACGTGRHTTCLQALGHDVIGVDASPEMLAQARKRLPDVAFHKVGLHRLPLPGNAVDTVVCALALTHVPGLAPVLAKFARVLRSGGSLVISDAHLLVSYLRPALARRPGPDGRPSSPSTTVRSALSSPPSFRWTSSPALRGTPPPAPFPRSRHCPGPTPGPCVLGLVALVPGSVGRGLGRFPDRGHLALPIRWQPEGLSNRTRSTEAASGITRPDRLIRDSHRLQVSSDLVTARHRSDSEPDRWRQGVYRGIRLASVPPLLGAICAPGYVIRDSPRYSGADERLRLRLRSALWLRGGGVRAWWGIVQEAGVRRR